jgi:tRNA/tmRNA/rRNA uracil-C5-methylase (TrmA/RlmC/RlmD family)
VARVRDDVDGLAGVVVFVRHAIPGEKVVAEVTEGRVGDRYLRADAVEVLRSSPDRVVPPCPAAGPGGCGGCDFQHVTLGAQRRLKAAVVAEQLSRLAGIDVDVAVEPVPGDDEGLRWRTRVQYAVGPDGRPGLRKHRSHEVIAVVCLLAHPDLPAPTAEPGDAEVEAIATSTGQTLVLRTPPRESALPPLLRERVGDDVYEVTGSGFWQVHPGAAATLREAVMAGMAARPGERVADLYAGVGLFSLPLARAVGESGRVEVVESATAAVEDARRNLAGLTAVRVHRGRVDRVLDGALSGRRLDRVVLDPPRAGARRPVVEAIARAHPRRVVYVACDPASLGRDLGLFGERGYGLDSLRAFDLFPMTHHVECVAVLSPRESGRGALPDAAR